MKKHLILKETVDKFKENLENMKRIHALEIEEAYKNIAVYTKLYQDACPHDKIRTEDDFDYHNNTDWSIDYCAECGKYLKRY